MERFDEQTGYCRMLGHYVPFSYCRQLNDGLPCRKVLDCWYERMDVESYIKEVFTEAQIPLIFEPPKPKVTSLVDLIQAAQKRVSEE